MAAKKKPAPKKRVRPPRGAVLPAPSLASLVEGDTKKRLERFCEVHHDADPNVVIYTAINDFITADLEKNKGASDAFNTVR